MNNIFPSDFLWGTATAAHQVEDNNSNCDSWVMEHLPTTIFAEPAGDAIDHYHRYPEDMALLAELGFKSYRISIEWARIEPEEGHFSKAALDHYRRMLETCHANGLTPKMEPCGCGGEMIRLRRDGLKIPMRSMSEWVDVLR